VKRAWETIGNSPLIVAFAQCSQIAKAIPGAPLITFGPMFFSVNADGSRYFRFPTSDFSEPCDSIAVRGARGESHARSACGAASGNTPLNIPTRRRTAAWSNRLASDGKKLEDPSQTVFPLCDGSGAIV
jgi:hypothetical protein